MFKAFVDWRKENAQITNLQEVLEKAKAIALNTAKYDDYDTIHDYYSPFIKKEHGTA